MIQAVRLLTAMRRWTGIVSLACGTAVVCLNCAISTHGQAFVVTGGSSSVSGAHGGSFELQSAKSSSRIDIGTFGKLGLGFSRQMTFRNTRLNLGDQAIGFTAPTDGAGVSYYFLARGISAERKFRTGSLTVFLGATSSGFRAPFLNVARSESLAGAVLYERQITPTVRWVSRDLFARRLTSLQSVEWSARHDLTLAMTGGVGSGQGYWASSMKLQRDWLTVDGGYVRSGAAFRRIIVQSPQFAETDRENVRIDLVPTNDLRVVVSRDNYLSPPGSGLPSRASVSGFGVWTRLAQAQFNVSLFEAQTAGRHSQAFALGVRRPVVRRIEAGLNYLSQGRLLNKDASYMGTVREAVTSRLSLNQVITRSGGQTSVSYGGSLLSNLLTISADYQTVFLPFVTAAGGQVRQVLMVGVHLQLPHGIQVNGDTSVDPTGRVRYTSYGTTYGYRAMSASPGASASGGFFRYQVHGRVTDVDGQPIEGAAVQINTDLAFTNSRGEFFLRVRRAQAASFSVVLDEFVIPGRYEVVSAPSSVQPDVDGNSREYDVVIRRLPNVSEPPGADSSKP